MTAEDTRNGLNQRERELDAELRFDFEQRVAEKVRTGMDEGEARRAARLEFGGIEQVKEECRDARGWQWLEELAADTRYAIRLLRQNPGFAAVALVTLALGTGATTLMFTILSGVLLHPLPFPQPDRLIRIYEKVGPFDKGAFSYLDFLDLRHETQAFHQVASWRRQGGVVSEPGEAEFVSGYQVSGDIFPLLGIQPVAGRTFRMDEDAPGAVSVAMISYDFWQSRFGGRHDAVGARIVFDAKPWVVIGVLPKGLPLDTVFGTLASEGATAVITPISQNTNAPMQNREMHPGIGVVGRLRSGITLTQAQADLAAIASRLSSEYPKTNQGNGMDGESLEHAIVGDKRSILLLLFAAVSVILLIACANIASLLLARALSREHETAMRVALGARRGRLIRQCITESVLLALGGGLIGTFIAVLGTRPFLLLWPDGLPRMDEVRFDWRVFLFAFAASLLCGVLFGLVPALRSSPGATLQAGARTPAAPSRRLHGAFIVSEISLAIVLLVAAGLLARAMLRLSALDPGLDPHNVLAAEVALSEAALQTPAQRRAAWEDLTARVAHIPGVVSAAIADVTPMTQGNDEVGYWTTPAAPPVDQAPIALLTVTSPDYARVMGIAVRSGRFFDAQDRQGKEPVAVIDELLARSAFAGSDPTGKRMWLQFLGPVRIVGVVAHVRHWGLYGDDIAPVRNQIYLPAAQIPDELSTLGRWGLFVRTGMDPVSVVGAIRIELHREARGQALFDVRRMEDLVRGSLAPLRFLLLLFGVFAGLALLLAAIGVYGVLAYLTSQRVPEIGVRMALGASEGNVMRLILRQGLVTILVGVAIGVAGSVAAARAMEHLDTGVRAFDPVAFAVMIAILIAVALLAISIPARRASRLDPAEALRHE